MALSFLTRKNIMIFVIFLSFTGLVFGILAIIGVFNKKHSGSPKPPPPPTPTPPPTPPFLGLEVVAVSGDDYENIIYDNKDIKANSQDGKYFYFIRGTPAQYGAIHNSIRKSNHSNLVDDKKKFPVQQWRNTGNKYENIWTGTVNLISGVGGRLEPYNLDQTNTKQDNNAAIWKIGDYVVYAGDAANN